MPASVVPPSRYTTMPASRGCSMSRITVLLPHPAGPVIQMWGRQGNHPHSGASAAQPAMSGPDASCSHNSSVNVSSSHVHDRRDSGSRAGPFSRASCG